MKNKTRKLRLDANTIRVLATPHLAEVQGGKTSPTNNSRLDCPPPPAE